MSGRHASRRLVGGETEVRAIVAYRRADGAILRSIEGAGRTVKAAVHDADEQLRPGRWIRVAVSTLATIRDDLDNAGRKRKRTRGTAALENVLVTVPPPRERGW